MEDEVYNFIIEEYLRTKKPVPLIRIKNKLQVKSKQLKWILIKLVGWDKIEYVEFQYFIPNLKRVEIPIHFRGKIVGYVRGNTFYTKRGDIHVFEKFEAFGLSLELIKILKQHNVKKVVFNYQGKKFEYGEYETNLETIEKSELEFDNKGDIQKFVKIEDLVRK
jgi:hypothetical protein